jgi:HSP20 family protein
MAVVRYNPWQEMSSLQRQFNRLFNETLTPENWGDFANLSKVPAVELTETENAVHLKLEIPGMEAKDLDIQVTMDRVAISGERKSETKTEEHGVTRSEFHYGKFSRVIPLPARIQNTNVTADYKDGILNLTLPKAEEEKNKVVKIDLSEVKDAISSSEGEM